LHLPFLPSSLEDLDSINFALGLRDFDVARHQPHPPGYPLFIAAARLVRTFVSPEARALSAVSIAAGSLSVLALMALYRRIAPESCPRGLPFMATLVASTCPLYWFTAARPLSDMPGLAAALGVQALALGARSTTVLAAAGFLAALAAGIRSQVAWLTVPLLVLMLARRPPFDRRRALWQTAVAFLVGVLVWAVPLVVVSGGPGAYWRAIFSQGAEDLSGIRMLWTSPTPRQLVAALDSAFVAPWAIPVVAAIVLVVAAAGALSLARTAQPALVTLLAAFAPYLVFDLLFQETVTT